MLSSDAAGLREVLLSAAIVNNDAFMVNADKYGCRRYSMDVVVRWVNGQGNILQLFQNPSSCTHTKQNPYLVCHQLGKF
jgi:hypothetical protein